MRIYADVTKEREAPDLLTFRHQYRNTGSNC
jgi:hypothetical protein